jgi:hypothetical protein
VLHQTHCASGHEGTIIVIEYLDGRMYDVVDIIG